MTDKLEPPSDEFLQAFSARAGSILGQCGFCGRTSFNGADPHLFDDGELVELRRSAEKKPGKYVETDYSITFTEVGGRQYVDGCPCNGPRKYEDWIWDNRREIARYLNERAEGEFKSAEQTRENVKVHRLLKGDEIASDILDTA